MLQCSFRPSTVKWRTSPTTGGISSTLLLGSAITGFVNASPIPTPTSHSPTPTILFSLIPISSSVSTYSVNHLVLKVFFPIDTIFVVCLEEENKKELITLGLLEWNKARVTAEIPRYGKKVPKIVNIKVSPRHIQQPR